MTTSRSFTNPLILVTGGTGTTGHRIVQRLRAGGVSVRVGSRSGTPPFDWDRPETWAATLDGVTAAYIAFSPDLAMPGAVDTVDRFSRAARRSGVERLVLLAGRGEDEALAAEHAVQASGASTIVRASWFAQNFSEGMLHQATLEGLIALPAGTVREPFVDVDDIAEVAGAALIEPGHEGRLYDVTGPRLMTFADAARELSDAMGRPITYVDVEPADFVAGAVENGVEQPVAEALAGIFVSILDGRNAHLGDGVQQSLGRAPGDFAAFAHRAAAAGAWSAAIEQEAS